MRPPAGLRSPAPDPKPRGAAWKWGITHAGDARSPKSTAAPSPWDLMQVNPPPPRDRRASTATAPRTPTITAAGRRPRPAPLSRMTRARPIRRTWIPSARKLARTNVTVSMTATYLVVGFASALAFAPAAQPLLVGGFANRIRQRTCEDDHLA